MKDYSVWRPVEFIRYEMWLLGNKRNHISLLLTVPAHTESAVIQQFFIFLKSKCYIQTSSDQKYND